MSQKKTRPCTQCGEDYIAWPANRKYCGACQALRDLNYRPGMSRQCEWCDTTFWPFRTNYTKCPACAGWRPERPDEYPACSQCGKHKRTAPGLENTCVACVQEDSAAQAIYHRSLSRIIRERIEKNHEEV